MPSQGIGAMEIHQELSLGKDRTLVFITSPEGLSGIYNVAIANHKTREVKFTHTCGFDDYHKAQASFLKRAMFNGRHAEIAE